MLIAELCIYPSATPADPAYKPVYPDIHSTGQREERTVDAKRELSLDDLDKVAGGYGDPVLRECHIQKGSWHYDVIFEEGICPRCRNIFPNPYYPICYHCETQWIIDG